MIMRRLATTITIASLLAAGPAWAFEPTGADIIGLHLGMSEADATAALTEQGYAVDRGPDAFTATTKDGRLQVAVSPERGVTDITYVFLWRGAGAPIKIRDSIVLRFGNPDQATPPTWCRAVGKDGVCPANQAYMTYLQDALTLRLTAGRGR
jgi:hypothetical protein